jgi:hypothetical protein
MRGCGRSGMPASRFTAAGCGCDGTHMPRLIPPTTLVRTSYLQGEIEAALEEGIPTAWLEEAAADFAGFVARRRTVRELWGVPVTEL